MILFFIAVITIYLVTLKSTRVRHNGKVYFCDRGIDGHNERVAEFYGYDSYREMLKSEGIDLDKIEEDVASGKLKRTTVNLKDFLDFKK